MDGKSDAEGTGGCGGVWSADLVIGPTGGKGSVQRVSEGGTPGPIKGLEWYVYTVDLLFREMHRGNFITQPGSTWFTRPHIWGLNTSKKRGRNPLLNV